MVLRRRNRNRSLGAQLPAEAIFVLTSAQDIAKLIKIITFFFVQFAMRSGHHTGVPGVRIFTKVQYLRQWYYTDGLDQDVLCLESVWKYES